MKVIEQILAVAERHEHSSTQSQCGMLGGAIGALVGWKFSWWIGTPPAAGAFVVAVVFVFLAFLLYRAIGASKIEKRIRVWANARTHLDLAIMAEEARPAPDRAYLERLQKVRLELTVGLNAKDSSSLAGKTSAPDLLPLRSLDPESQGNRQHGPSQDQAPGGEDRN